MCSIGSTKLHHSAFAALHRRRRLEKVHGVDWRIELTSVVTRLDNGPTYWSGFIASGRTPEAPVPGQRPSLPPAGYAHGQLNSVKFGDTAAHVFRPPPEELLMTCGYATGVRECVADA